MGESDMPDEDFHYPNIEAYSDRDLFEDNQVWQETQDEMRPEPPQLKVYLIGSLRNYEGVAAVAARLRDAGFDVFDDWSSPGPEADEYWQAYERERGRTYMEALRGHHAQHVFAYDKHHLDTSAAGVLLMPCGKSGHMELGYLAGQGKPTFVLFDSEPERFDIMYNFATGVFMDVEPLVEMMEDYLL